MTVTTTRLGLEDFFAYTSDLDTLYELEDGELIEMPPESDLNQRIASFLFAYFLRQGVAPDQLRTKTEIAVMGVRTTVRVPDLLVLSEELATALEGGDPRHDNAGYAAASAGGGGGVAREEEYQPRLPLQAIAVRSPRRCRILDC